MKSGPVTVMRILQYVSFLTCNTMSGYLHGQLAPAGRLRAQTRAVTSSPPHGGGPETARAHRLPVLVPAPPAPRTRNLRRGAGAGHLRHASIDERDASATDRSRSGYPSRHGRERTGASRNADHGGSRRP